MSGPRYSIFAARAVFDTRLTATDVRVLAALGTHSNNQGWLRASQGKLAKRIGVARTTVTASIKRLCKVGYLETQPRYTTERGQISSLYRVKLDTAMDLAFEADIQADPPVSLDDTPCQNDTPRVVPADTPVVPGRHPLSSQDDTIERSPKNDHRLVSPAPVTKAAIEGLIARAGDGCDPTAPSLHSGADLNRYLRGGCDWDEDILPAVDQLAASFRRRRARFGTWSLLEEHVIRNRDRRLAGLPPPQPVSEIPRRFAAKASVGAVLDRLQAEGKIP